VARLEGLFEGLCYGLVKKLSTRYQPLMKLLLSLFVFVQLAFISFAQEAKTNTLVRIVASEAKTNIGTNAIVTGKIAEVNKTERIIRLNFGAAFPNNTFTAVIFPDKMNLFPDVEKLKDAKVEVSGKITAYREHPQIVLNSTNQLKVLEKAGQAEKK